MPEAFRILFLGKGGREHALAWRLSQSPIVHAIFIIPGNAATESLPKTYNAQMSIDTQDFSLLLQFIREKEINFVIPSQEQHIAADIASHCSEAGIKFFGPTQKAAILESSKAFSKNFMTRHTIKTAKFSVFNNLFDAAVFLENQVITHDSKLVVKASGITNGKGVLIISSAEEVSLCLDRFKNGEFGPISDLNPIIVEEYLKGLEFSVVALVDGRTCKAFPPLRDYKRRFDQESGPNTGGMGCVCPLPDYRGPSVSEIVSNFFTPTLEGMIQEGRPMSGILCIDFIQTYEALYAIEYDTRFGDPEIQTLLPLLHEKTDLAELLFSTTKNLLHNTEIRLLNLTSVAVVVVAEEYPATNVCEPPEPREITLHQPISDVKLFHSSTILRNGKLATYGGRVLTVVATDVSRSAAIKRVYKAISKIEFDGRDFRSDIGASLLYPPWET
ncbi:phosphoribosylformylglycinamidine cyclo-ligase [Trichoderma harzianum]|uniref:phosphoribosylamine--glycine ligase n=1 Tax=Trichoderma harzianum TaxID=5544 RepID=A0A0F9ZW78_TRIHA|nr:phosphoribosylformylglycinamidine cyclo-ligase [Trichoderma harzianum]